MTRQRFPSSQWKRSVLNNDYSLCESYPSVLYFPTKASDVLIQKSAGYRSKGRVPALTYFHRLTGGCIVRCSQPLAGLGGKLCIEDQFLLESIRQTTIKEKNASLIIFDARSRIAAGGNRFRGKGTEDVGNAYPNCKLLFMDIGNIHTMRESVDSLHALCTTNSPDSVWLSSLESTSWFSHIRGVMSAGATVARNISERGLAICVHCSDGWDRTSQICALAQLLLDPYYRTFAGFLALIEKDFIRFGHKFHDRLGKDQLRPDERSPIFLQFIEATWQVLIQFPEAFEFSPAYLIVILQHLHSGWFGNFLVNNEREMTSKRLHSKSVSLWAHLLATSLDANMQNHRYDPDVHGPVVIPAVSVKKLRFWYEFYLMYDESNFAKSSALSNEVQFLESEENLIGDSPIARSLSVSKQSTKDRRSLSINVRSNVDRSAASPQTTTHVSTRKKGRQRSHSGYTMSTEVQEDSDSENAVSEGESEIVFHRDGEDAMLGGDRPVVYFVPMKSVTECKGCNRVFHILRRKKHHCKVCGNVFCSECLAWEVLDEKYNYKDKKVRVCDECRMKI